MKNSFKIIDNEVHIDIPHKDQLYVTIIDIEDFDKVNSFKTTWNLNVNRTGHFDGIRTKTQVDGIRKQYWLHNIILEKLDENNVVDHINHNTLDNRKINLREVTKTENSSNSKIDKDSASKIRNVYIENGKYAVRINNKRYGRYDTIEEAIEVANYWRKIIFPLSD